MSTEDSSDVLQGKRLAFVGKLASMARRDAAQLVRQHGATVLEKPDASADLIVVGEDEFPLPASGDQNDWFDEETRRKAEQRAIECGPPRKKLRQNPWTNKSIPRKDAKQLKAQGMKELLLCVALRPSALA